MSSWELGAPIRTIVIAGEQGSVSPFVVSFQRTSLHPVQLHDVLKLCLIKKKVELCELMLHVTQVPMVYDVVGKLGEGDSNVYNVCSYVFTDLLFEEYC